MDRQVISTSAAPAPIGAYSQAIAAGGLVFTAGQIPLDPATGRMVEGDIRVQATRALENLKAVLAGAGLGLEQVVKTTVFLADLADGKTVNEVYAKYFGSAPPARSTVGVALPLGARIEIEAIAVRNL
ncbi:MAG: 2-iminobutanoate/2-iminopropanoate deaminase [Phycisphaerae bacterium]|nr:2-iminobutanoate/2-iminopropanoate deaminase [Phycisphaerae bacterium]